MISATNQLLATLICALIATIFVGLLYAVRFLHPGSSQNRNDPRVVKQRMAASLCSCILSALILKASVWLLASPGSDLPPLMHLLGLRVDRLLPAVFLPFLLTSLLFLGPLSSTALLSFNAPGPPLSPDTPNLPPLQRWILEGLAALQGAVGNILLWRDLVVAPMVEEFVFRGCVVPLLLVGGWKEGRVVLLSPLFFGLAHIHHYWGLVRGGANPPSTAALIISCQIAYTTVFGWYASFLFLRTGVLAAPVVAHMVCNFWGFPDFQGVAHHPQKRVVSTCFVLGAASFGLFLLPLTATKWFVNGNRHGCSWNLVLC